MIRGGKIIWLDLGMMGTLSERDAGLFRQAVKAVTTHDVEQLVTIVLTIGVYTARVDKLRLYEDIDAFLTKYGQMSLSSLSLGAMFTELMSVASAHKISLPGGLTLFGRSIINIEGTLSTLAPDINVTTIMSNHISGSMLGDIDWKEEAKKLLLGAFASGEKLAYLPAQLSGALSKFSSGQGRLLADLYISDNAERRLLSLSRRLICGLLSAASLIGGCILALTGRNEIFGVPYLTAILLLLSLILCVFALKPKRSGG